MVYVLCALCVLGMILVLVLRIKFGPDKQRQLGARLRERSRRAK
jgi:hypothetical protein